MEKITIRRPIILKAVVTEELRRDTLKSLEETRRELEAEIGAIDAEARRLLPDLEKQNLRQAMETKRQIEAERKKRVELEKAIEERIEEVRAWRIDDEVVQGRLEGVAEVRVGDDLNKIMEATIVVKDGKVIRINEER